MNSIRKWIRNVFGFSGNEINGFLILVPLMLVLIFSEPLYHSWIANGERHYADDNRILDSLVAVWDKEVPESREGSFLREVSFFTFDPNTVSVNDLMKLGFPESLANRVAAYRQKGGVFRIKSDLMKIYGLDSTLYKQLYSFIRLPSGKYPATNHGTAPEPSKNRDADSNFDINTADTTLLKTVYGIGPVLAARVLKFRDALGGFVLPDQVYEVYGLDSMVVMRLLKVCFIRPDFVPEQININTADEKLLSRHPYIRYSTATALVKYRFQHGDFTSVSDIKKLAATHAKEMERLLPYLKLKD